MMPSNVFASDELITTEWIMAAKLWNFKKKLKRQNQLVVASGDEVIPLNKNLPSHYAYIITYISNNSTVLPLKSVD